jgi:hypothetical protein
MEFLNNLGTFSKAEQNKILRTLNSDLGRIFWEEREALAPRDRMRYREGLNCIAIAFEKLGFSSAAWTDLDELAVALGELDHGTVRHFLAPAPRDGKPIDPTDIATGRAWACIAIDILMSEGFSRKGACRLIASNHVYLAPILSPDSEIWNANTIENWHQPKKFMMRDWRNVACYQSNWSSKNQNTASAS